MNRKGLFMVRINYMLWVDWSWEVRTHQLELPKSLLMTEIQCQGENTEPRTRTIYWQSGGTSVNALLLYQVNFGLLLFNRGTRANYNV